VVVAAAAATGIACTSRRTKPTSTHAVHCTPAVGCGRPPQQDDETQCWFCVSSAKADTSLLITIGDEVYLALPKVRNSPPRDPVSVKAPSPETVVDRAAEQGPLTPEHLLLIPIQHVAGLSRMGESGMTELERFKKAVQR
jgi:hypothetical protein